MWLCIPTSLNVGTSEEWQSIFLSLRIVENKERKEKPDSESFMFGLPELRFVTTGVRVIFYKLCKIFHKTTKFITKFAKLYLLYLFCKFTHIWFNFSLKFLKFDRFDKSHVCGLLLNYVCAILEFERTSPTLFTSLTPFLTKCSPNL